MKENENSISIEKMILLSNPKANHAVAKLVSNRILTEDEITLLSTYTTNDIATIAMHLTTSNYIHLQNGKAILNGIANGIANENEILLNYQRNMATIEKLQLLNNQIEKGPTR